MAAELNNGEIERLVAEHVRAMYRYAYRLTGCAADAEDLCQQSFLQALAGRAPLRDPSRARQWLLAMVRNGFRKLCHQRTRHGEELPFFEENFPAHMAAEDSIDRERLQLALDGLPTSYRSVLLMFYFEQLSYREMAEQLGLPIGTIMSRLARAKAYLRYELFAREKKEGHRRADSVARSIGSIG